jgi:nucleoside-diphosphate-sugar epimerase
VYASSSSVYGHNPDLPKNEELNTLPLSPYAVSKLAAENYCSVFTKVYGLQTISLRYFNVFGPRQDPDSQYSAVIPRFIKAVLAGMRPTVYGDGEQTRDFTYIENVVKANILASVAETPSGSVMNCACGVQISLNELIRQIGTALGRRVEPLYDRPRIGDVKHSFASIERAHQRIGYLPLIGFKEGLQKTVDWYLGHLGA